MEASNPDMSVGNVRKEEYLIQPKKVSPAAIEVEKRIAHQTLENGLVFRVIRQDKAP